MTELTDQPGPLIPGRHHESMRAAWASEKPTFSVLIKNLEWPLEPNQISSLKNTGLLGHELVFKLSVFGQAHDELRDSLALKEAAPEGWFKRNFPTFGKLFKRALKAADVILGSIGKIPGLSLVEVINEFKESAESGIDVGLAAADVTNPRDSSGSED